MAITSAIALLNRLPVFPLFAGISLTLGLLVPTIFELGEQAAARSRHRETERAAVVVLAVTLITTVVCWYWSRSSTTEPPVNSKAASRKFQFGLRGLLIAITGAGVLLAAAPWLNKVASSAVVVVAVIFCLAWSVCSSWPVRSRMGALLASVYLPFIWMILYNKPFGHSSGLIEVLPISPAIVPAAIASRQIEDGAGIAASIIVMELIVGAWLARRGGKLNFAFLILVLLFSCFNSFVMHVLYRA